MSDDELIPYDLTPEHPEHYVRVPPGWEFRNVFPRSKPLPCRVYWGSHGCRYPRGHAPDLPHECDCCPCGDKHPDAGDGVLCVAKPPYYGSETRFYGEDAEALGLPVHHDDPYESVILGTPPRRIDFRFGPRPEEVLARFVKQGTGELDRRAWISGVKARLGIVAIGDDPDVIAGRVFGDGERAKASLQVEEEIRRREVPFEFEAIAHRLGEYLPEGHWITFGPVTEIDLGEDEP